MAVRDILLSHSSYLARHPAYRWFYFKARAAGWSPHTLDAYEGALKGLSTWAMQADKPADPLALGVDDLREWLVYLMERGSLGNGIRGPAARPLSGATVNTYARTVRAFFAHAVEEKRLAKDANPWQSITIPKAPKNRPQLYQAADIEQMLNLCPPSVYWGARDRALLLCYLFTGLRLAELATLRLADVDLEHGRMKVLGKGDKERFVGLHPLALSAIHRWLMFRPEDCDHDFVFTAVDGPLATEAVSPGAIAQMVRRLQRRAGVHVRRSVHAFRHTFAVHSLLDGNLSPRLLQEVLGHATYRSTEVYTQTVDAMIAAERQRDLTIYPGWNLSVKLGGRNRR